MPTKKMTVSEWIKVQDNPIQRDTERHAAKAKHLMTPLAIHAIVYAARLPDNKLVKLDGHTRALLWKRNQVRHPSEIECNIIDVASMDEAKALYRTLDSKEALETIRDKISGAFSELNFVPESGLLKSGSIANALRLCWNVKYNSSISGGHSREGYDLYSCVQEFSSEIFALDSFDAKSSQATSGIIAAFILTNRKHGATIIPFWRAFWGDGGEKKGGFMDPVQSLNELVLQRQGRSHGGSAVADMACRAVMAAEKWLLDEDMKTIPKPYDLTGYIDGSAPSVRLIKGKIAA